MQEPALEVKNLSVAYGRNRVLTNACLSIPPGRLVGVMGPNGAGKSTLLKALMRLEPRHSGTVSILGKSVKEARAQVAYIPQRNAGDWDFPIDVFGTVLMGTYPRLRTFQRPCREDKDHVWACLEQVNMTHMAHQQIGELSGGQQQRVFTARALAQRAEVLFLDEPFVGIDATSQVQIIRILKDLVAQGKTVVVVHHDLSNVHEFFDDVVLVNRGIVAHGPTEDVMTPDHLAATYGQELLTFGVVDRVAS